MPEKRPKSNKPSSRKKPASGALGAKQPQSAAPQHESQCLRFRFGRLDHGKWELSAISKTDHGRLLKKLAHFEEMTVAQARASGLLADYDVTSIPNRQATQRLVNQYGAQDSLCRLYIASGESLRLLGIRERNEFHIVWWDPNHNVWPEGKIRR